MVGLLDVSREGRALPREYRGRIVPVIDPSAPMAAALEACRGGEGRHRHGLIEALQLIPFDDRAGSAAMPAGRAGQQDAPAPLSAEADGLRVQAFCVVVGPRPFHAANVNRLRTFESTDLEVSSPKMGRIRESAFGPDANVRSWRQAVILPPPRRAPWSALVASRAFSPRRPALPPQREGRLVLTVVDQALKAFRRREMRTIEPASPKPPIIMAHVAGSGTAERLNSTHVNWSP